MSPIIAIVAHTDKNRFDMPAVSIPTAYTQAVEKAGGIPLILPFTGNSDLLPRMAAHADGFLFPGGFDMDPAYFNEAPLPELGRVNRELDVFQVAAFETAMEMKKPVLGICRGAQLINVALGGSLFQDIASQFGEPVLDHMQKQIHFGTDHPVEITRGSRLFGMFGSGIMVNSRHHQSVKDPGAGLRITAKSPDGVVEALEHTALPIDLVQWHPELMMLGNQAMAPLFSAFVRSCKGGSAV
ncbi:MAG: gamma-glutamyl-gamma-aminobutyrate hydrolase family protein [Desulfobacterales bacterium]|nr:gamma-glutamyl-gamma-aminobutyrate hydrolase family protein [Desulfobacterales bacterium]